MSVRLHRTVALVGMMGAGKTAVGTQLAAYLGVRFLDSDEAIVAAAKMSVAEIFARDGEAFFRRRESEVIGRLLRGPPMVLSTGGGAFLQQRNRELIRAHGIAVWLRADLDLLWARVKHRKTRPLLQTAQPYETLAQLHAERAPVYACADIVVDAEHGLSVAGMALKVLAALARHPQIVEGA